MLSPQLPAFTQPGAEKQGLGFPILNDRNNKIGALFGLAFRLPEELIAVYKKFSLDLPRHNGTDEGGDESWRLSIPARIVIGRDGVVAAAEADPDYTHRPPVGPTVDIVRKLAG